MSAAIGRARPAEPAPAPRPSPMPAETGASSGPVPDAAIPLGQLLHRAARAVKAGLPGPVWVLAAVAATKPARGGFSIELVEPDVPRAEAGLLRAYLPDGVVELLRRSTGQAIAVADLAGMTIVLSVACELHPRWGLSGRVLALGPGIERSLAALAVAATVARLSQEGLFDRQRRLQAPRDVTRVAVVHPPAAAGWADISGQLARWARAGLLEVRSLPVPFEGAGAGAGIAAAVARATAPAEGARPDVVLLVRGGGAAAGLGSLDDEALARAIAAAPVPVVTGLGHASDGRTLADRVAWRSVETPSKTAALVREIIIAPGRRAQDDHAAIAAAVSAGVERAVPRAAALERRATAEALRQAVRASERLDRSWGAVREAAEGMRGRLRRLDDGLDRLAADITAALPVLVGRTASDLAALIEAIRARARRAGEGADDGARHLAAAAARAVALVDTAGVELANRYRATSAGAGAQVDRAAADVEALARTVRERGRAHADRADDGARALALARAAVVDGHRAQGAATTRLRDAVETAVARRVDAAAAALDRAMATLDGADPSRVLSFGYVMVMDGRGHAITSVLAAEAASTLVLTFADGTLVVAPTRPQPSTLGDRT